MNFLACNTNIYRLIGVLQMAQELCELFINDAEDGKWIEHVRMELRPHYPIRFKSVHAICAKQNQLGNFKEIAKQIYLKRNPPQHLNLVEEKDVRRKQNVLI